MICKVGAGYSLQAAQTGLQRAGTSGFPNKAVSPSGVTGSSPAGGGAAFPGELPGLMQLPASLERASCNQSKAIAVNSTISISCHYSWSPISYLCPQHNLNLSEPQLPPVQMQPMASWVNELIRWGAQHCSVLYVLTTS